MHTIAGIFDNDIMAEKAVAELLGEGFVKDDISLLMSSQTRDRLFSSTDDEANRVAKGAVAGATVGGALGALLVGLTSAGAIITSGGALLVAGPIVAALSGAGAGALTGGVVGALVRAGFAADEANRYESEINSGKAVVIAHAADERRAVIARAAFNRLGAVATQAA